MEEVSGNKTAVQDVSAKKVQVPIDLDTLKLTSDDELRPDKSCGADLEEKKPEEEAAQLLPRINGDVVFSVYLIVWIMGLLYAMKSYNEGKLWPPYLPYEEQVAMIHTMAKSAGFNHGNYWIPAVATLVYSIVIFLGPKFMASRNKPKYLKSYLLVWNTFLFVGSTFGAYRILPPGLQLLRTRGAHALLCWEGITSVNTWNRENTIGYFESRCQDWGVGCLWMFIFIQSKIPEMIDTFFLVVGKKRVRFLHWYHHISVLWFCWLSWAFSAIAGTTYTMMNITVHSVMYFWYTLASANNFLAVGIRPGRSLSQFVTVMQIAQMVAGTALTFYIASFPYDQCLNHQGVNALGVFIYSTYLFLFVRFFCKAYCFKQKKLKDH